MLSAVFLLIKIIHVIFYRNSAQTLALAILGHDIIIFIYFLRNFEGIFYTNIVYVIVLPFN